MKILSMLKDMPMDVSNVPILLQKSVDGFCEQ